MNYSIVTPVKNEEKYIEGLIESVRSQTVKPLEWIVVDDCSLDETTIIVENYGIRCIPGCSNEVGYGKNVIKLFSQGFWALTKETDIVVKLDADVRIEKDYFETILREFEQDDNLGLCGGWTEEQRSNKHVRGAFKAYRSVAVEIPYVNNWDSKDEVLLRKNGWKIKVIDKKVELARRTHTNTAYEMGKIHRGAAMPFHLSVRKSIKLFINFWRGYICG